MTNILTSVALSALSLTFQPDIRSAYIARGRVAEDRPIQANMLRLSYSLDDYGYVGLWHWNCNSLTTRYREKRDRQLAEVDYGIFYGYDWKVADKWTLKNEVMLRWFTFPFFHSPYNGVSDHSNFEYYFTQTLQNPYVIPTWHLRKCTRSADYLHICVGLKKPIPVDFIDGLKITPAVYVDFGDDNQRARYGKHPEGKRWGNGVMSAMAELRADYPISDWCSVFATLQQFRIMDEDGRDATHSPCRRDLTVFSTGLKMTF